MGLLEHGRFLEERFFELRQHRQLDGHNLHHFEHCLMERPDVQGVERARCGPDGEPGQQPDPQPDGELVLRGGGGPRQLLPDEPVHRRDHHLVQQGEGAGRQGLHAHRGAETLGQGPHHDPADAAHVQDAGAHQRVQAALLLPRTEQARRSLLHILHRPQHHRPRPLMV